MRATNSLVIGAAALLLVAGMAGIGAASPAEQTTENSPADGSVSVPAAADGDGSTEQVANGTERGANSAEGAGPADGLPAQAPAHVSQIHDRIESFLNGSIEDLGASPGAFAQDGPGGQGPTVNGTDAKQTDDGASAGTDSTERTAG